MLPTSRPRITRESVIDLLIAQALWKDRTLKKVVLVGIRGYYLNTMGEQAQNDRGIYDDAIIILTPSTIHAFNGNTDPSRYRSGVASLVAPQRIRYRKGWHGYNSRHGHPAFRQDSPVIIARDGDTGRGHRTADGFFTDAGLAKFWINLHRGGHSTTSSAGCQTIPPNQWRGFYKNLTKLMSHHNQQTVNYYLVENTALAE